MGKFKGVGALSPFILPALYFENNYFTFWLVTRQARSYLSRRE